MSTAQMTPSEMKQNIQKILAAFLEKSTDIVADNSAPAPKVSGSSAPAPKASGSSSAPAPKGSDGLLAPPPVEDVKPPPHQTVIINMDRQDEIKHPCLRRWPKLVKKELSNFVEAHYGPAKCINTDKTDAFLEMFLQAFGDHCAMQVSPDTFINKILEQVTMLIQHWQTSGTDTDKQRLKEVLGITADDQKELVMFVNPEDEQNWKLILEKLSEMILDNSSPVMVGFLQKCYTSTQADLFFRITSMMTAMSAYFRYTVHTRCGILKMTLLGSLEDWMSLNELMDFVRLFACIDLGISEWVDAMQQVLDTIYKIVRGDVTDEEKMLFLRDAFVMHSSSGQVPSVNGWCTAFYYLLYSNDELRTRPEILKMKKSWNDAYCNADGKLEARVYSFPMTTSNATVQLKRSKGTQTGTVTATTVLTVVGNALATHADVVVSVE